MAVLAGDENLSCLRILGVLLGTGGSILTALHDLDPDNGTTSTCPAVEGDIFGLISAMGFAGYAVQARVLCPRNESFYSMQLVLGYMGFLSMLLLLPVALYVGSTTPLSWTIFGALVLKGLMDNVLSDYLWLSVSVLTSATVASVGLSLAIPFAFSWDLLMKKPNIVSFYSVSGAMVITAGFVLVTAVGETHAFQSHENLSCEAEMQRY